MSEIIRLPNKGALRKPEQQDTIRLQDKETLLKKNYRKAILLIDGSGSMDASKKKFATKGSIAFARGALEKNYAIGVIGFASDARLICKPTTDAERIGKACGCWPVSGGTFIGSGLTEAQKLGLEEGDAIVVVTDGACGQPEKTLAIAFEIKRAGIEILAIGTDDADQPFLKQLASRPDLGLKVDVKKFESAISDASRLLKG